MQKVLPTIPDHVLEARSECAYEFLDQVLLPKFARDEILTPQKLRESAIEFKSNFHKKYPNDFFVENFQPLPAVIGKLSDFSLYYKAIQEDVGEHSGITVIVLQVFT